MSNSLHIFFESHSANTQNINATTVKIRNHIKTHVNASAHRIHNTLFWFRDKKLYETGADQTIRQRKIENILKIKAKNKAKDMQTTKKTLTTVKSVPLRMLESLTFLVLPKMSQGSWTHLWYSNFVVNTVLVFLLLIIEKMKEEIKTFLYQTKRSSM